MSAIKGAAYIIKKREFKSDGQKGPRQPLPCTVYKLGFQFHCFWLWGRGRGGGDGAEAMVPDPAEGSSDEREGRAMRIKEPEPNPQLPYLGE